jgi:protein-disulfide isomerase
MMKKTTAYSICSTEHTSALNRRQMLKGTGAFGLGVALTGPLGLSPALAALSLEDRLSPRIIGDPDAPVHMAEYFSLSCSHCANFHHGTFQKLKSDFIETGRLRFEMRDFPLQGPAIYAHALARSVPVNAYPGMIDILFKRQRDWAAADDPVSALARIARIAGIGSEAFGEIIQNRPLLEGIVAIAQDGYSRFNINSTPSFTINDDRVIRGDAGYDEFLSILNEYSA